MAILNRILGIARGASSRRSGGRPGAGRPAGGHVGGGPAGGHVGGGAPRSGGGLLGSLLGRARRGRRF